MLYDLWNQIFYSVSVPFDYVPYKHIYKYVGRRIDGVLYEARKEH
jgi:hypothetical protein